MQTEIFEKDEIILWSTSKKVNYLEKYKHELKNFKITVGLIIFFEVFVNLIVFIITLPTNYLILMSIIIFLLLLFWRIPNCVKFFKFQKYLHYYSRNDLKEYECKQILTNYRYIDKDPKYLVQNRTNQKRKVEIKKDLLFLKLEQITCIWITPKKKIYLIELFSSGLKKVSQELDLNEFEMVLPLFHQQQTEGQQKFTIRFEIDHNCNFLCIFLILILFIFYLYAVF